MSKDFTLAAGTLLFWEIPVLSNPKNCKGSSRFSKGSIYIFFIKGEPE